jgi:FkbM family methyltransferase
VATFLWGPEQPLIVPTPEPAFLMHDDDSGRCQMFQVGIPELALVNFAKKFSSPDSIFIDGGAHMGVYSILLADSFKHVYSFEPQKRTFFQLCGNIFINEKDNITPYAAALTDVAYAGVPQTLSIVSDDGGGSTLEKTTEKVKSTEIVDTTCLDKYNFENVGLIKLDVEGSEYKALLGASHTLARSGYPPIIFECNDHAWYADSKDKLFKYLTSFNYSLAQIQPFPNMYLALQKKDQLT